MEPAPQPYLDYGHVDRDSVASVDGDVLCWAYGAGQ